MSQINFNQGTAQTNNILDNVDINLIKSLLAGQNSTEGGIPPDKIKNLIGNSSELPTLPNSKLASGGSLPLEILLEAIGAEIRNTETKAGIATVKANAAERQSANEAKIKKIEEQIEKLDKASVWDKIANVFKWIGMAVAAIGCAAMIATGVGAGVGVAGLVLLGVALGNEVLDTVGQAVSGRGWGLTSLAGWAVEAISGSESAGKWVKLGLDVAITVASMICSCGASSASAAGTAAGTVQKVANIVTKASSITKAVTSVAQAGSEIASAVYTYDAEKARADQKRLEAILEQIQLVNEVVTKHMEKVIEDTQKNSEIVSDIVKDNAQTQTTILTTGGGTQMA